MNLMDILEVGTIYYPDNYFWLWNDIVLDSRLDKSVLCYTIVAKCAQSYPLYTTCDTLKTFTEIFFRQYAENIKKMTDTLYFDYNPIWNKDGKIRETHVLERDRKEDVGDDATEKRTTNSNRDYNEHGQGDSENTVSAFDSGGYQPHDKNVWSSDTSGDDNMDTSEDVTKTRDIGTQESEGINEITERIEQGNIGVTTTQSMIKEEREIQEFNIYEWIANLYHDKLFMKVW